MDESNRGCDLLGVFARDVKITWHVLWTHVLWARITSFGGLEVYCKVRATQEGSFVVIDVIST